MLNRNEYQALMRQDFLAFLERCFLELNGQQEFRPNWHHEILAERLEAVRLGTSHRMIVNVPPRYLKSIAVSVAFTAWMLGHNPTAQILCVSYGQDLADKHARDTRTIMSSDWYRELFPDTRLSPQRQAVSEFMTTKGGVRMATSVGGVLTGRGADIIVIDDPLKPEEAISDVQRRNVNEWYDHTLYSRLNSKENGSILIVMHRLHQDDLVGHVLDRETWEVLSFPAIAEIDQVMFAEAPYGRRRYVRKVGDVLHPQWESREALDQIRKTIGEYNFAGQYQQSPAPQGGGMIKAEWLLPYDASQLPGKFEQVIQSWDTANKANELSNYSVCTTWGVQGKHIYLLNVLRRRMNYPDLKRAVREQCALFTANVILIEDKASGTQLIQELTSEGMYGVTRYEPDADKVMRMHAQTGTIEAGFVHIPREAHWLAEYLHELVTFPKGKYDDQVDSTAQALDWITSTKREPNFIAFMRMELEKTEAQRNPTGTVRMRVPPMITEVHPVFGPPIPVPHDRIIEVDAKNVKSLMAAGYRLVT